MQLAATHPLAAASLRARSRRAGGRSAQPATASTGLAPAVPWPDAQPRRTAGLVIYLAKVVYLFFWRFYAADKAAEGNTGNRACAKMCAYTNYIYGVRAEQASPDSHISEGQGFLHFGESVVVTFI